MHERELRRKNQGLRKALSAAHRKTRCKLGAAGKAAEKEEPREPCPGAQRRAVRVDSGGT